MELSKYLLLPTSVYKKLGKLIHLKQDVLGRIVISLFSDTTRTVLKTVPPKMLEVEV
jgi:hypothetical protein